MSCHKCPDKRHDICQVKLRDNHKRGSNLNPLHVTTDSYRHLSQCWIVGRKQKNAPFSTSRRASPSKITYWFLPVPRAGLKQLKKVNHRLKTAGTGAFFLTSLRQSLRLTTVGDEKCRCQWEAVAGLSASWIFPSCVIKVTNKASGRPGAGIDISSISGGECPRDDQVQSWQGNMHTQRAFVVTGIIFHFSPHRFCENPSRPQELDDILHRTRLKHRTT